MMKHERFHLSSFLKTLFSKELAIPGNHHMFGSLNDPCNWHSNAMCIKHHQCEQMKFTSLVTKVASIENTPLSLNETMACN